MTDKESFVRRDASMGDLSRPTYFNYNFQGPFAGRAHLPASYVGPFLTLLALFIFCFPTFSLRF